MSFGFSFGDFMVVLTLAKDLAIALSETRGVSVELQRLMTMLDSLQKAVNNSVQVAKEWDLAHPDPSNKAPFNALVEEHNICKTLLENFWKDSEKYTKSIVNGQGSKVKRELAKIKWCIFHCDDAVMLERNLSMHVMAINLYSCELRCGILRDIANTNSAALAVVGRNVSENTKLLQCIQRKSMRFSTQTLSAGLFPHDAPLTLLDAIGREFPIHFYLTGSFNMFHGFLKLIFENQRGYAKIMQREYNIADEDGEGTIITEDNWTELIKPGMTISLSMILRKSSAPERACPRCNTQCIGPELAGRRLRCQLCQVTFRMSDQERIVELPERSPNLPTSTSIPTQKDTPATSRQKLQPYDPSKALPRDEDIFQRVHIIREITTIKGQSQSEDTELQRMAAKLVEKGDAIGLKALLQMYRQRNDDTYLITAARKNLQFEAFRLLVAVGEDVRDTDYLDKTPLHRAPDKQTAQLLISHGADVHAVDYDDRTPLYFARDVHIARLLIAHGAAVHIVDDFGRTPLYYSRYAMDGPIARLLISHGADVHAVDNEGGRP